MTQNLPFPSLCHLFQDQVQKRPTARALLYKKAGSWREHTWRDFQENVFAVTASLQSLGVSQGDRVCLLSENRPEWVFCDFGILHAGALNVPLYPTNIASQIAYTIQDCGARIAFVSNAGQLQKLREIESEVPGLEIVVYFDEPGESPEAKAFERVRVISWPDFLAVGAEARERTDQGEWTKLGPDHLATLIYTSGTTGNPKGVMLSHGNLVHNAMGCRDHMSANLFESEPLYFSFLPLSHAFERTAGYYWQIAAGVPIAYAESMEKIVENIGEVRPTRFCGVPRIFEKIRSKVLEKVERSPAARKNLFYWALKIGKSVNEKRARHEAVPALELVQHQIADRLVLRKIRALLGGRIHFLLSGGGPLMPEIARFFDAVGIRILQGYGLTETSPVVSCNVLDGNCCDTVGIPLPGVQVRIAQDGEILVRGGSVMQGYFNRPAETREMIKDGWLYTGDIGVINPNGHLRITDRKKDIIVTAGGKNVAPQNIENQLKLDPLIEQVCVIGDRRKYISSLIVPNFSSLESYAKEHDLHFNRREELIGHQEIQELIQKAVDRVNSHLAPYESIKKFTLLPQEFTGEAGEITPTMKIKRRVVEKKYAELIEAMY